MKTTHFLIVSVVASMMAYGVKGEDGTLRDDTLTVVASQFTAGDHMSVCDPAGNRITFVVKERSKVPQTQQHVRQDNALAKVGPSLDEPYYQVRMALPIPSAYTPTEQGALVGLDEGVYHHMHSAALEALPNGDMLAIYFSTPVGLAEKDTATTFVQCRRRAGNDYWDMPELLFDTKGGNDQSALLFRDGQRIWFFGGGRGMTDMVPFRVCYSDDNGVSWTYNVPRLDKPASDYTAQPVSNAFRDPEGNLYIVMDAAGSQSFLWRSSDNGLSWHDMGGRTDARHSSIVPLDDKGTLLSIGGKNNDCEGWNPQNISHDWGATWEKATPGVIPPLGTAQRPNMIRLQSGNLLLVTDSYQHKKKIAPPAGWKMGNECVCGVSKDNGKTWTFKALPGTLPQHHRVEHPSVGYVTVRQSDNGMIHILTTTNYPGLEIEFNEAWFWSAEGDLTADTFAPYNLGEGWTVDTASHTAVWTQYWPNGQKRVESTWNIWPTPRDGHRPLCGRIAEGPARHYDEQGHLVREYMFHEGVLQDSIEGETGIKDEGL